MPPLPKKKSTDVQWNEIDELREKQLFAAVDKKQDEENEASRGIASNRWFERYNAARVAFEEGRERKLINLEKSLGIVWKET
jgi:hypothetical protein